MTRIVLADDEALIRSGLRKLLELTPDFTIVAEAADGIEALEVIECVPSDILLLDIFMPRLDGLGVLDALRERVNKPATLVLTTFDDPELLLQAARREARGFIPKAVSLDELNRAIIAIAAGATWFQPTVTSNLRRAFEQRPASSITRFDSLTDREIEVLKLVAGGFSNRQIASAFAVADGTVKNQVSSILAKLGVHDRTLAVLKAIEARII